ncbi:MAG: hypothetical protein MZV65_36515 [Chromatiales bacterium]|nr:hypothetical protein [Chromatiales bacterium]
MNDLKRGSHGGLCGSEVQADLWQKRPGRRRRLALEGRGQLQYVARANALENNVSLYYTEKGNRNTIKYVDAPVPRAAWSTLRVEFSGRSIKVLLNGKSYIELENDRITGPGAVGVWTKADSVTAFDDFSYDMKRQTSASATHRLRWRVANPMQAGSGR